MMYTSSEAAKLLKKLNDNYSTALYIENSSKSFLAATGENPDEVRPEYDYCKTQENIQELEDKIRIVKHAINIFNTTTVIPEFNITIDEMLVYLPQLTKRVAKLEAMSAALPKVREKTFGAGMSATIDYRYANYDIAKVQEDYDKAYELLARAHSVLDQINNSEQYKFEIDI